MNWRDPKKTWWENIFRRRLCLASFVMFLKGATLFNRWTSINISATCNYGSSERLFGRAEAPQVGCQWSSNVNLERRAASPPINSHVTSISWDASCISIDSVDGCHGKLSGWRLSVPKGNDRAWSQLQPFRESPGMCESDVIGESQRKSEFKPIKTWLIDAPGVLSQSVEKYQFNKEINFHLISWQWREVVI